MDTSTAAPGPPGAPEQPGLPGTAPPPPPTVDRARLLTDAQPYCLQHALALAGPEALRLHGLPVGRAARTADLQLITAEGPPLADLAGGLAEALRAAGHLVREAPGTARRAQLTVTAGPTALGLELRREPLHHPPILPAGAPVPVTELTDTAALAVLTLCERALPADLFALYALTTRFREGELLALASAFDEEFTARTLADRLETAAALLPPWAPEPRQWAEAWAQDLRLDLLETTELADGLHDPYLDALDEEPPADDL
ncbi:hypothetical protein AB0K51_05210 [Kitasatospora sp. NPDC049285]|uniref:hypothetical protein n=1 Tax=Kitasatospora sp. NPDC049285 TaxID=3157096 RepID=UPI00342B9DFD